MSGETQGFSYESIQEKVDPEFSAALDKAAEFVTSRVDLIVNG